MRVMKNNIEFKNANRKKIIPTILGVITLVLVGYFYGILFYKLFN